jgi:hypothetical protein
MGINIFDLKKAKENPSSENYLLVFTSNFKSLHKGPTIGVKLAGGDVHYPQDLTLKGSKRKPKF